MDLLGGGKEETEVAVEPHRISQEGEERWKKELEILLMKENLTRSILELLSLSMTLNCLSERVPPNGIEDSFYRHKIEM